MRSTRTWLVVLMLFELCAAGAVRWRVTAETLHTEYDYLLGQEVIAGDNWRREGAWARHFVPSRSIDQALPEWAYRDDYWRDYLSQPPLSFILQYAAMRAVPSADPVVAGKVLAQLEIALAVVVAAAALYEVFGFAATLIGLSFFIWGRPILVFLIDGYYASTPAILFTLLLVSWCLAMCKRAGAATAARRPIAWPDYVVLFLFAYLGTFSEWFALIANAVAVPALVAYGVLSREHAARRAALVSAAAIFLGAATSVLSTLTLYGSAVGYGFFLQQFMSRVAERTGAGGFWDYTAILIHQMETAWPPGMLIALAAVSGISGVSALVMLRAARPADREDGRLVLLALLLALGAPLIYCYRLKDLVTIHWWFSGTWVVGWTIALSAFVFLVTRSLDRWSGRAGAAAVKWCVHLALLTIVIGWNVQFAGVAAQQGALARGTVVTPGVDTAHELYRAIGRGLPRDDAPLVAADMPDLFDDYPFATAYVRRPVVRLGPAGALLKLGTSEDAGAAVRERGGYVDVLYDPTARACAYVDATPQAWQATALAVCRVPAAAVTPTASFFRADTTADRQLADWTGRLLDGCCPDDRTLLDLIRAIDSRFRIRSGAAIEAIRKTEGAGIRALTTRWRDRVGGHVEQADERYSSLVLTGIIATSTSWYLLVDNPSGDAVPEFDGQTTIRVNGNPLKVLVPYQISSADRTRALPFSLIEAIPLPLTSDHNLTIDVTGADGGPVLRSTGATLVRIPDYGLRRSLDTDALLSLSVGCSAPPGAPLGLRATSISRGAVRVEWIGATGGAASYVAQAGTSPGGTDVTNIDLRDRTPAFAATEIPAGQYFVRVRGKNFCGLGPASNEITVAVR